MPQSRLSFVDFCSLCVFHDASFADSLLGFCLLAFARCADSLVGFDACLAFPGCQFNVLTCDTLKIAVLYWGPNPTTYKLYMNCKPKSGTELCTSTKIKDSRSARTLRRSPLPASRN
jgi:hypothetical protein